MGEIRMMDKIKKLLSHLLTEVDNHTYDLVKILALISVLVGLGLMAYAVIRQNQPFSFQDFGTGVGLLFTGVGVALSLKKESKDA